MLLSALYKRQVLACIETLLSTEDSFWYIEMLLSTEDSFWFVLRCCYLQKIAFGLYRDAAINRG